MPLWNGKETPEEYEDRKQRNEERAAEWAERQRIHEEKQRAWEEAEAVRSYNRGQIEHLTMVAQNLYYTLDFYSGRAHDEMKHLQSEAKKHAYVGRDYRYLVDAFWAASQEFYKKRDDHFLQIKRNQEESRQSMEMLLNQAERIASNPAIFKAANEELRSITEEMRKYRCNKKDSDYIWIRYREIISKFRSDWDAFMIKQRERWDRHKEIARDRDGNKIGEYKVGNDGYVQQNVNSRGDGHTTGHASGYIHKHGSHSDNGGKQGIETGSAPSGNVIGNYIKK